ncbi:MAG: acylase [Opitutus sp.]|nr:acylase [Opitutus sp.]
MKTFSLVLTLILALAGSIATRADDLARWQERARHVTIIRDSWGVPHIYGRSDADTVFGLLFAQAEDDFNRVELNYINALGRLAEIEGEGEIFRDLRMKLFIGPADMQAKYAASPSWLRALMEAFADGLNFYLHTHPAVRPKLITHFEPWMALTFSEGSIGGDIESISVAQLERFYGPRAAAKVALGQLEPPGRESGGSNGFALAPQKSASGHALLLINPHTTFYFRPEVHAISEEGLNAYGAVTWGQFFIYQGFNDRCGWMHTSDGGDVIDEYLERVSEQPAGSGRYSYAHDGGQRPLLAKTIVIPFQHGATRGERTFTAYFSHHGPIVREAGGKWIAVKMMQDPVNALTQSYQRTKARSYAEFYRTMELRTNTSNNTVYADADGTIAYFHGDFIPRRDPKFDWSNPVDGSDPATEWQGLHPVEEIITLKNPASGWIQNTNNWPFSAAGPSSPRREDYPLYMWTNPENARGLHATQVLSTRTAFTLDSLIAAAYDNHLPAFETLLPALFQAYEKLPAVDSRRAALAEPIALLRGWDRRSTTTSMPAAVALIWAEELAGKLVADAKAKGLVVIDHLVASTTAAEKVAALERATARLARDFGTWKTPWGEINRFQRVSGDVNQPYDDAKPSLPVGFAPGDWGSLAAFGVTGPAQKTRRIYGNRGNSFVAVVEFGPQVKAKSLLAGGVSGDPKSPHFNDQAPRYTKAQFKDVLFYRDDVTRGAERTYHPGE